MSLYVLPWWHIAKWSIVPCFFTLTVGGSEPIWTLEKKKGVVAVRNWMIPWLCCMLPTKTFWCVFDACYLLLRILRASAYKNNVLCSLTETTTLFQNVRYFLSSWCQNNPHAATVHLPWREYCCFVHLVCAFQDPWEASTSVEPYKY